MHYTSTRLGYYVKLHLPPNVTFRTSYLRIISLALFEGLYTRVPVTLSLTA